MSAASHSFLKFSFRCYRTPVSRFKDIINHSCTCYAESLGGLCFSGWTEGNSIASACTARLQGLPAGRMAAVVHTSLLDSSGYQMFLTPLIHRDPQNWQQTLFVFTEVHVVKVALKETQKPCSGMHVIRPPPPPNYLANRTIASVCPALCDDLPEQKEVQDSLCLAQLKSRRVRGCDKLLCWIQQLFYSLASIVLWPPPSPGADANSSN